MQPTCKHTTTLFQIELFIKACNEVALWEHLDRKVGSYLGDDGGSGDVVPVLKELV